MSPQEMSDKWAARAPFIARKFKAHIHGKVCNDVTCESCHGVSSRKEESSMKASEMFGGQFLSASDLDGKPITGNIDAISTEVLEGRDGKERERIIMHLSGIKKPMVINATNGDKLITAYGDETDNWVGNKVTLAKGKVRFGKDWVDTIVVTPAPVKK